MKRPLFPIIIILSLLFSLSGSIYPVQASLPVPALDLDQDGISNTMEINGWYDPAGILYKTNPNKADSDSDGLTDAEEKLFNTNPNDSTSPGIAVKYDNAFKTREYYSASDPDYISMIQGGNQYLLTEALVIRRGTTFKLAAVNSEPASLTFSGGGITAVRDRARGGWKVTVPAGGAVGAYTATITNGDWHKDLPIYVIFELPTGLTQAQIDAFLYDDDPANQRDEVAVWWRVQFWKYYNDNSTVPTPCNPEDPGQCSNWPYHTNYGYAQAFWTEQFTKNVLVNHAIPAIQGNTTPYDAAVDIADEADRSVRVNYSRTQNNFTSATAWEYDPNAPDPDKPYRASGGACETNAGAFTSILRSAGIPSRPFNMDYNRVVCEPNDESCNINNPNTTIHHELGQGPYGSYEYDHAVILWVKDAGDPANRWYAERISIRGDGPEAEYQSSPVWQGGTTGMIPLDQVGIYDPSDPFTGFGKFRDIFADLIQTVNEGWDWEDQGGMVGKLWDQNGIPSEAFLPDYRDYRWDSRYPLVMDYQSPYVDFLNCQLWTGDTWAPIEWVDPALSNPAGRTARQTYNLPAGIGNPGDTENWPFNPKPYACSPSSVDDPACTDEFKNGLTICTPLPGQTFSSAPALAYQPAQIKTPDVNSVIQLGDILSSTGLDRDGDGRFDALVVRFEITSSVAGEYQLGGYLGVGEKQIRAEASQASLVPGTQTVQLSFDGQAIGDSQVDGPYQVEALWVAPADQPVDQFVLPEEMSAYHAYTYATPTYQSSDFIVLAAYIGKDFTYSTTNSNPDQLTDSITISVPLSIAFPGAYTLKADLYDRRGEFVGQAKWTGSDSAALLEFQIAGTQPPYSLQHLNLYDDSGRLLDARYAPVFTIEDLAGKVEQGKIDLSSSSSGMSPQSVTPKTFTITPVDSNGNGKVDVFAVSAMVDVATQGGSFWMEGLLVDDRGTPAAWSVSNPQTLPIGQDQTLTLNFDARLLYEMPFAGSQKFTLVAVKIFSGAPGTPIVEANVPVPGSSTLNYTRDQLEPSSPYTLFQDDMEGGNLNKWSNSGNWGLSLTGNTWHSWSHAASASGTATRNGTLSVAAPLDLRDYASPWLRFNAAYQLVGSDSLKLEVSTNGTTWTPLVTYPAGSTSSWTSEVVDLSAYGKTNGVQFRFNGQTNSGHEWAVYLDDVFLFAGPAVKSASFTYSQPVKARADVTFTASYDSINKTLPVTYKWDFCGVTREVLTPTIIYQFPHTGDCQVKLTVDNAYDSAAATPQTVTVMKASPTITVTPGPGGVVQVTLQAAAVLANADTPTGSITFHLFAPDDASCSGDPAYTETAGLNDSSASTVTGYKAEIVGTWHWTASYAGDENNNPASSSCTAVTVEDKLNIFLPMTIKD